MKPKDTEQNLDEKIRILEKTFKDIEALINNVLEGKIPQSTQADINIMKESIAKLRAVQVYTDNYALFKRYE